MIKTKIFRLLPLWLSFLSLAVAAQTAGWLLSPKPGSKIIEDNAKPQVLGASTTLRGELPQSTKPLIQIGQADLSNVSAESFLVFDLGSGQNLLTKNPDQKLGIASLTKLMTAYVAYENVDLNQTFKINHDETFNIRPVLDLKTGDQVQAWDIFNAMLVGSNNDAALALAGYVSEATNEKFVNLMNTQAQTLHMSDTNYSNALGFDSLYNYSTASDLKTLISATEKLAAFTNLGRRETYDFSGSLKITYHATATNKLLAKYPDIHAIKTGYTENSGGAMATKVDVGSREIVIIVLDSQNREADTLKLRDAALKNFSWD